MQGQKILALCPRLPYPLLKGDQLRAYYLLKELSEQNTIEIFGLSDADIDDSVRRNLGEVCAHFEGKKLGKFLPKLRALLSIFTPIPAQVAYFFSPKLYFLLRSHLRKTKKPDVVLLFTVRAAGYLSLFKDVPIVLDHIDCLSLNAQKRSNVSKNPLVKLFWKLESLKLKRLEKKISKRIWVQFATAKRDANALAPIKVDVIPNGVDSKKFAPAQMPKRIDAVFTGNFGYPPNSEAALWFKERVLPLVTSNNKDFKFYAVGAEPPKPLRQAADERHFFVTGFVNDMVEYLNSSKVFVAPIQNATGIQNKVLEAMSCGLPVIATPEAVDAIKFDENPPLVTARSSREFAQKIEELLSNSELADMLGKRARKFVEEKFSWRSQARKVEQLLWKARKLHTEYKWEKQSGWVHPECEWVKQQIWLKEENQILAIAERAFALVALILLSPLLLALCACVFIEDGFPLIYSQYRVGKRGKLFKIYKLRTMRKDAEKLTGAVFCSENDSRVLKLGRIFRKLHLDELFQIINIIKGDMSLIGPRPERPEFVSEYSDKIKSYWLRHLVKPGITGWAQVNYPYSASFEDAFKKLGYDLFYVRYRSPFLILKILFKTPLIAISGWGAR